VVSLSEVIEGPGELKPTNNLNRGWYWSSIRPSATVSERKIVAARRRALGARNRPNIHAIN
jgi:hypothetical protein